MARQPIKPQSRQLTPKDMEIGIERLDLRLTELNELDIGKITKRNDAGVQALAAAIADTLVSIFGDETPEYNIYQAASDLDTASFNYAFEVPWSEIAEGFTHGKDRSIRLLTAARRSLNEKLGTSTSPGLRAVRAYGSLDLHPEIARAASKLFADGHYSNAVEAAVKGLNGLVRLRSGLEVDGTTLMEQAFSPKNPVLKFNALADQSDTDEQRGFMMMFSGAVSGLRNPRAHKFINDDPERALEFIAFVSLLAKLLDGAT